MAHKSSDSPQPGWRQAAGRKSTSSSGKQAWKTAPAPTPAKATPEGRKRLKLGLAVGALAVVAGLLTWFILWPKPPQAACLVLIGSGYEDNLAIPHNAHGWKTLEDLAELERQGRDTWMSWRALPHLRVQLGPEQAEADTNWKEEIWKKALANVPEKTCILFFALHGGADEQGAFLWANDPATKKRIYIDDILTELKSPKLKNKTKLLILDATQVTAHWPSGMLHNDFVRQLKLLEEKINKIPNLVVLCASDTDQRSRVSREWQRSVFSHYVIEGLKGAADSYKSESGYNNNRVTIWELYRYVRDKTELWADYNRHVAQTPIILGDRDTAKATELVQIEKRYTEQPFDKAPGLSVAQSAKTKETLQTVWKDWHTVRDHSPPPQTYSPHLWRHYQQMVVRLEQLLRMGDPTKKASKLLGRLSSLKTRILKSGELLSTATSFGNSLPMPSVMGISLQASPAEMSELEKLFDEFRSVAEAKRNETWIKIDSWLTDRKGNMERRRQLLEAQLSRWALEELAETGGNTKLEATAELLEWINRRQSSSGTVRSAETHFAIMLPNKKMAPPTSRPDDLLRYAIKIRLVAESCALATAGNDGRQHPYSELVQDWIAQRIDEADAKRRLGEDWLFGTSKDEWKNAKTKLEEAEDLYVKAKKDAEVVRTALATRDRVWAVLPFYAKWVAGQWTQSSTVAEKQEIESWTRQVESIGNDLEALDLRLAKPNQQGDGIHKPLPADLPGEDNRSLAKIAAKLNSDVDALNREFFNQCEELLGDAQLQEPWHKIENALAVPLLDDISNRGKLIAASESISNKLHLKQAKSVSGEDRMEGESKFQKENAQRQGLMALSVAGSHWDVLRSKSNLRNDIYGLTLGNWRTDLLKIGKHLREHWQKRLAAIKSESSKSHDSKDLQKALQLLTTPEHFCRVVTVGDVDKLIPRIPDDPVQSARKLRMSKLLAWQAKRFWKDHWFMDPDIAGVTYYKPTAERFLDDAERLVTSGLKSQTIKSARKSSLNKIRKQVTAVSQIKPTLEGGDVQQITTDKPFKLTWKLAMDESVPRGVPMVWLEVDDPDRGLHDPPNGTRLPLAGKKLLAQTYTLQSKQFKAEDPPLPPKAVNATAELHGVYRGQKITSPANLVLHSAPDLIVSRYLPPPRSKVAVYLDKDVPWGSLSIVLDFSQSMDDPIGNGQKRKIDHLREAFRDVLSKIPEDTYLSVLVFGGKRTLPGNDPFKYAWIRRPERWNPTKKNIELLMREIAEDRFSPKNPSWSAIAESILEAKINGFPRFGNIGTKIILALTDGYDTYHARDTARNGTEPAIISKFMRKHFEVAKDSVEINMVCFTDKNLESKRAEDQFGVIRTFEFPAIPGTFQQQQNPGDLAQTILDALRPKVLLYHGNNRVATLQASYGKEYLQWNTLQMPNAVGVEYTAKIQNLVKQDMLLRPGEALTVRIARGHNDNPLVLKRAILGSDYKEKRFSPDGNWIGAVLQNKIHTFGKKLEQLISFEEYASNAARAPASIRHTIPEFIWFEVTDKSNKAPGGTHWRYEIGHPAPTYHLQSSPFFPSDQPTVKLWHLDRIISASNDSSLVRNVLWSDVAEGKTVKLFNETFLIEKKRSQEQHFVTVGPNQRKEKQCWVLQIRTLNKNGRRSIFIVPDGDKAPGEEHQYFDEAGRYVALFWGTPPPASFNVISLDALKKRQPVLWNLGNPSFKDSAPAKILQLD